MNYFINDLVKLNTSEKVNAQGKARRDIMRTFADCDYEVCNILNYRYSWGKGRKYHHYPLLTHRIAVRQAKRFLKRVRENDCVAIQDFHLRHMQYIATECLKRKARVILIIHDVQCIRFAGVKHKEVRQLNNASLLIVHTPAMINKLNAIGIKTPMLPMQVFDYYTNAPMCDISDTLQRRNEIVFAGNLAKSYFLKHIASQNSLQGLSMRLYGLIGNLDISNNDDMKYCGVFEPDDTARIQGGWGLVWDGNSIDTCSGDLGNYLHYNSSHKTSLYLACGMPLIVWEESALASWVIKLDAGIAVASINDISDVIASLTDEEYRQKVENARHIGDELRKGNMMKLCLARL